jgi:hypothetical protein
MYQQELVLLTVVLDSLVILQQESAQAALIRAQRAYRFLNALPAMLVSILHSVPAFNVVQMEYMQIMHQ